MNSREELAENLFRVAVELTRIGSSDVAAETYKLALRLDPRDFRSLTNLAVIIDKSGQLLEAENLYVQAASHQFFDPFAMFNLGYLYGRTKKLDLAELWYRRCLVADPNYHPAMVNLSGLVQEVRGDLLESKDLLERALSIDPTGTIALYELANIYRQHGQLFEAEMLYFKAVDNDPDDPTAMYNYASFIHQIGEHDRASALFDEAHRLDKQGVLKGGRN
jgi:tetratricopeptide (TPR) repeat protein